MAIACWLKGSIIKSFLWTGKPIGLEDPNSGGVFLGDCGAGLRNANLQNQLDLQRVNTMNQINRMPPQYRGTGRPPL